MYGQYDMAPQFWFTGSSMPGLPTTLDGINPAYYHQIADFLTARYGSPAQARLASITGVVLYDTLRVDAGVLPTKDFVFFQNAVGSQQSLFVTTTTTYVKQEIDVTRWITNGGQLSKGYEALVWEISVQVHIVSALDDTLQTTGNAVNLTLAPGTVTSQVAADPVKMGNILRAFQEGTYFKLFVNQTDFEDGPMWRFPSGEFGASGFSSMCSGATAPAFAVSDGVINNGFGYACSMPIMRHVPELTKFGVKMSVQNPFDMTAVGPVRIVVGLKGIGIQPITG